MIPLIKILLQFLINSKMLTIKNGGCSTQSNQPILMKSSSSATFNCTFILYSTSKSYNHYPKAFLLNRDDEF